MRWRIGSKTHDFGGRSWVMGILNVTPDSFSDGGLHAAPEAALGQAQEAQATAEGETA